MSQIMGLNKKHNNHSDVDGVGAVVLNFISRDHFGIINSEPAFDWIQDSNENVCTFARLNPQYDINHCYSFTPETLPRYIQNRDGDMYDIYTRSFIGKKKKGIIS